MKTVRWMFAVALVAVALAGCDLLFPTKLVIRNSSSSGIEFIEWDGVPFGTVSVWEPLLGYNVKGLDPGYEDTQQVSPGSDYIYFEFPGDITEYRTAEYVTVDWGDKVTFTFYNSTLIVAYGMLEVRRASVLGDSIQSVPVVPSERSVEAKKSRME